MEKKNERQKWEFLCALYGNEHRLDGYRNCCEKFDQYLDKHISFPDTELKFQRYTDGSKERIKIYHKQKLVHEFSLIRVNIDFFDFSGARYIGFYIDETPEKSSHSVH